MSAALCVLQVQRGLAEAVTRTQGWLTTNATVDCLGTRVAGQAVKYARRVLGVSNPTYACRARTHDTAAAATAAAADGRGFEPRIGRCVGVCDFDAVLFSEEIRETVCHRRLDLT